VRELISSVVKGDFDWPEVSFLVGLRWVDSGRTKGELLVGELK
jgi:hypothetical protein